MKEKAKSQLIFNKDILIIRLPVTERNFFSLNHSVRFFPESIKALSQLHLILLVSDCYRTIRYKMHIEPTYNDTLRNLSQNVSDHFRLQNRILKRIHLHPILWNLSLIFIVLLCLLFILIMANFFLKFLNVYSKSFINIKCRSFSWKMKSEKKRKFVIVIYVTLRIIYTFIFTSTCIISIILTININSIRQNKSLNPDSLSPKRNAGGFSLHIKQINDRCETLTKFELSKLMRKLDENKNLSIDSWYQSKISLPVISSQLYHMNSSNLIMKIQKYLQKKIMTNIKLRLADQTGPLKGIVDETMHLKWLNIISTWRNEKENFNFNLLPIFTITQAQSAILAKYTFFPFLFINFFQ